MTSFRIGIDLGGTKVEGVVIDAADRVLERQRIPTPQHDYALTVAAVVRLVHSLEGPAGSGAAIGIGTPGAWEPASRSMKNCNSTWLNGKPLLNDLEVQLGPRVRVANDADCLVLSEARSGAGQGFATVFGAILGTGVGGGIVVRGELVTGPNAIAGEWGHTPLPYLRRDPGLPENLDALCSRLPDRQCYCGRENCVETFLSGPGLALTHAQLWGEKVDSATLSRSNSTAARQSLEMYSYMLARALAQLINVLDPHVIVLGGGLSNVEYLYRRVPEIWTRYVFSSSVRTALRPAQFGDSSGVLGAACLWPPVYNLATP